MTSLTRITLLALLVTGQPSLAAPQAVPAGPADTYISPCLFLRLSQCPAELQTPPTARRRIALTGASGGPLVAVPLGSFGLVVSRATLHEQATKLMQTIAHAQLKQIATAIDSLPIPASGPATLTGTLATHVLNWLASSVLEAGACLVTAHNGRDTLRAVVCSLFTGNTGAARVQGAQYATESGTAFFHIVLAAAPDATRPDTALSPAELADIYRQRCEALGLALAAVDSAQLVGVWIGQRQLSYRLRDNTVIENRTVLQILNIAPGTVTVTLYGDIDVEHRTEQKGRFVTSLGSVVRRKGAAPVASSERTALFYIVTIDASSLTTLTIDHGAARVTSYTRAR
jgi:hypothetical protein